MKTWVAFIKNKITTRVGKVALALFSIVFFSSLMFTNCAEKKNLGGTVVQEEILPLSCGEDCGSTFHPEQTKVENTDGQVMDVRQTLESFMSLLELKREDFTATELNALIAERNRRMALLPQENDLKLQSSVSILSQATLAGEVCKVWAMKRAPMSDLVTGIDLKQPAEITPANNWVNLFLKMAQQTWGRPLDAVELVAVQEFYKKSLETAATSQNRSEMQNGYNVESINLLIMSCTGILSAPEAVML